MVLSVLITGGAGFLGSSIVEAIVKQYPEWTVTVLDLRAPALPKYNVAYEPGDVAVSSDVDKVVEKINPNVIIHSAGMIPPLAHRYGRQGDAQVFNVNVIGTHNMLAAATRNGVRVFVYTSSCAAVTDDMRHQHCNIDERWPTSRDSSTYGESKARYLCAHIGDGL